MSSLTVTHSIPPSPERRLLALDGLRGVAILMVLVCHYGLAPDLAGATPGGVHVLGFEFFGTGVDLFFVLSGFLIGGILLDQRQSGRYYETFYARRTFRIVPVYFGVLLLIGALGLVLHARHRPTPVFDAGTPYWMFFLSLQNFSLAWYGDWGWITVSMAWSLALEEQCYLMLPLAVRTLERRTLVAIAAALIAVAPVLRAVLSDAPHTPGTLVLAAVRADALAAGFICAVLKRSRVSPGIRALAAATACLAPLVLASHLPGMGLEFLRGTALLSLYSCILLLAVGGALTALESPLLRFFGTISYSLYLVHQSALVLFHSLLRRGVPSIVGGRAALVTAGALAASTLVCWLSWRYFEQPLLSWARARFRYAPAAPAGRASQV